MPAVLSVAYPFASVGPDSVGGAEQVLAMIDSALVQAGWKSIIIAQDGSNVCGALIPVPRFGLIGAAERSVVHSIVRDLIDIAINHWNIDLVHMHGVDFDNYLPRQGLPVLVTAHLPPEWYPRESFYSLRRKVFFNAVSISQYARFPPGSTVSAVIENGVEIPRASLSRQRRGFVLTLGRICREKGFHLAIDAAIHANCDLILAGQVFPYEEHQRYFSTEILPRLDAKRRFIGSVGRSLKFALLSAARCILIPSLVPETSSLVAMEALACGTPAIAFPSGALPEIIAHQRTGFIVNSVEEMTAAISNIDSINREYCRAEAVRRFSRARMTSNYIDLYSDIMSRPLGISREL